ncbi:MAG: hypothetical protein HQK76_20855 [Desulfobacterales bacterium]|nr:hypothetical protein [Desulfobacterales bacterium]
MSSYKPVQIDYPTFTRKLYYDKLERVTEEIDLLSDNTYQSRSCNYNKAGNITEITDEQGQKTAFYYDTLNRLIKTIDAKGGITETAYDDRNNRIVWNAVYDSFGNINILTEEITNNLRFSGQYFDAESGLYYNWFRYSTRRQAGIYE